MKCMTMRVLFIVWISILIGTCLSEDCPSAKADIAFVVDDSSSVQRSNFKLVLGFIQGIVQKLDIGRDAVQVGFVSFSNTVKHQFYFNDKVNTNQADLVQKIGNIIFRRGGTDIARALTESYEKHFQDATKGGRDDAAKMLVLITDGTSTGTEGISKTIRDAGIDILCVGITDGVDIQQLADIAGDPSKVFDARSFTGLGDIAGSLSSKACDAIQPEVHPCDSAPCQHSGTCTEKADGSYVCKCTDQYRGEQCESRINPCDSGPCQHSGTCVDHEDGQFSCLCVRPIYLGKLCEIQADPCVPDPCLNGGTCSSTLVTFTCECTAQYMGAICDIEIPVKPCEPNPCLHAGVCVEDGKDFNCRCPIEFIGSTCEIERTACMPSPCENEASCIEDTVNEIPVCLCKDGFGDINCRTGGLIPIVAEIGTDARFSCKNSLNISTHEAEIQGIEPSRLNIMTNQDVLLKTVGQEDVHSKLKCHYVSQNMNSTSSQNLPLIVVEKKSEPVETGTKLTCSAYTTLKNVNINITVTEKGEENNNMLSTGETKGVEESDNMLSIGETKYIIAESKETISKSVLVDTHDAEVWCSVTYDNREIWSGLLSEKKEVQPKEKEADGFPVWVWILLVIIIVGIITGAIIYKACQSCRRGGAWKRKSSSKTDDSEKGEDLKEQDKNKDFNSLEVENSTADDGSKIPLKSDELDKKKDFNNLEVENSTADDGSKIPLKSDM